MSDKSTTDFILSAELKDHNDQVRCITSLPTVDGALVTGSLDRTLKVWEPKKDYNQQYLQYKQQVQEELAMSEEARPQRTPPSRYSCSSTLVAHTYFVADVQAIPPTQQHPSGLIVSVSHDKSIIEWDFVEGKVVSQVPNAHASAITSVSVDPTNPSQRLITGSWDKTAKIWDNLTCVNTLEGHSTNVLCVLFLSNGFIVTGSGDGVIKIWEPTGEEIKTIVASTTCVRGLAELPGIGFLSVSNDGILKTWTLQGDCIQEVQAHSNLVYSVIVTRDGELITASEDKSVKIWKNGELLQTIEHPACVWQVTELSNGDIATACADCVARVFTREEARVAEPKIIEGFNDSIASAKKKTGTTDPTTLPTSASLQQPGKRNGEVRLVNNSGVAEAWSWNAQDKKWEKMGEVVDGPGVGGGFSGKIYYEGEMYDYVFDIELEQSVGTTKFKLPYNKGSNPFVSAQQFIWRHELPQYYLDQIARFIVQNSDQTGVSDAMDVDVDDNPFTGHQSYVPNPNAPKKEVKPDLTGLEKEQLQQQKQEEERNRQRNLEHFPSAAIMFDAVNTDGIVKKVKEFNTALKSVDQGLVLNDSEMKSFDDWVSALKSLQYNAIGQAHFAVLDKLLKWPAKNLFPVVDLLRVVILTRPGAKYYAEEITRGRDILADLLSILKENKSDAVLNMLFIRFAANIFVHDAFIGLKHANDLVEIVQLHKKSDNKNIQNAVATLILNLTVQFRTKQDTIQDALIVAISDMLAVAVDHDQIYRLLVAAGTLLDGNTHLKKRAVQCKLRDYAQQHTSSPTPKVHGVAFQLRKVLVE